MTVLRRQDVQSGVARGWPNQQSPSRKLTTGVLVQILGSGRSARMRGWFNSLDQDARRVQNSAAMAEPMGSLPTLNCTFLIFSASSIPLIVIAAVLKRLNPSIGP